MSAVVKSVIVGTFGLLLAIVLGTLIGESSWGLPLGFAAACIFLFVYLLFFRAIRLEALILGFLIFGYIVGNRGFAQLSIGGPLFFGEIGLAICAGLLVARLAIARKSPIPDVPLAWSICVLLALGGMRLYLDVVARVGGASTMLALRDSAVVYYAAFFFVAYQAGKDARARAFVDKSILSGLILLLPVALMEWLFPGVLMRITFRGNPLIFQKGDLITSFLAVGAFYIFLRPARGVRRIIFVALSLASSAAMLIFFQRAGLVGFVLAALLLLIAKQPRFLVCQVALALVGVMFVLVLRASNLEYGSRWLAQSADRIESIVDVSGTRRYRDAEGDSRSGNNQFRLVWWQSVVNETLDHGPWFGLGFGYDLARGFVRTYYGHFRADFSARSPHSIWLTVLGRMGIVGLLSFTVVIVLMCRRALHAALAVARGGAKPDTLANWCAVLVLIGASTFGVVLEGPMGGILFWSFLGLAASQPTVPKEARIDPAPARAAPPRPRFERRPEPALVRP